VCWWMILCFVFCGGLISTACEQGSFTVRKLECSRHAFVIE
jgi:hypothetical protein